jgi:F-type H+-transporting ATPase subunit epsilon
MIQFELLTPRKTFLADEREMIIVPGVEGDMGILQGHSQLVSRLRPGMVVAHASVKNNERRSFFVQGGFVEVNPDRVSILAEDIADLNETLPAAVDAQIEACKNEKEREWLLALQEIIKNPPYPLD